MYFYLMSRIVRLFLIVNMIVSFSLIKSQEALSTKNEIDLIQPPYLKKGDTVAIVAPSGILKSREGEIQMAKDLLQSWGLTPIIGANVFNKADHFAGTDAERCEDLQNAMDNPSVSAIWCARGGYGTVRILDKLDYTQFKQHPKWVIGYSDITALHNQVHNEGFQSIHALMCVSLTKNMEGIEASVETRVGDASGPLVGGNLTMLHTMLGSDTSIDTSGKILFIEEIGEYKYHIDRMLQSLKRAGYFDNCRGLIVGDMSKLRKNTTLWGTSIEQLILDALSQYDFPIAFGMPAGHEPDNRALVLGKTIQLQVSKNASSINFRN